MIQRRRIVKRRQGNVSLDGAVVAHNDAAGVRQAADHCEVHFPLFEDRARRSLAVGAQHHQHALLALRQHEFIGGHAGLTRRYLIQIQIDADAALPRHFDG